MTYGKGEGDMPDRVFNEAAFELAVDGWNQVFDPKSPLYENPEYAGQVITSTLVQLGMDPTLSDCTALLAKIEAEAQRNFLNN